MVLLHIITTVIPNFHPFRSISYRFQVNIFFKQVITFLQKVGYIGNKLLNENICKRNCNTVKLFMQST